MANQVQSVFGISPEMLQASRNADLERQALNYANLDPSRRAVMGMYQAGNQLGGALGGLMGGQDPELQKIKQRQELLQGLDLNDPNSLKQAAQRAMQAGDYQAAQELAVKAQAIEENQWDVRYKQSQIYKNTKEGNAARTPAEIAKAQYVAQLDAQVRQLEAMPPSPERDEALAGLKSQRSVLVKPEGAEKPMDLGDDRESVALEIYDKRFASLTPAERAIVNKRVEAEKERRAPKTTIQMPGQPVAPKDWLKFRDYMDKNPTFKRSTEVISSAPQVIETIRMSTGNDIAHTALAPQLARLAGESGMLSNQDISRWARTGGLDDRLIQGAASFFTGRTSVEKKQQVEKYATAVFRGALIERKKLLEDSAKELGYDETPNYKAAIESVERELAKFKKPGAEPSKPSGTGNLSPAEQQELQELRKRFGKG